MVKYFYVSIGILSGLSLVILMVVVQLDKTFFKPTQVASEPALQHPLPAVKKQPAPLAGHRKHSNTSTAAKRSPTGSKILSATVPNLRLAGTSFWGSTASAIIEDLREGKQGSYRVGDTIQGFKITDISKESVTLAKKGREIVLEVTKGTASLPPEELAWKINDDYWGVSTKQVTEKVRNIDQYEGQIAVYQHYEDAKPAGFLIHHLAEGNDIEALGIEDGDVIQAVNGLKIDDMSDVLRAFYKLSAETEFQVAIKRNNEIKTICYQLDTKSNLLVPVFHNLFDAALGGGQ